MALEDRSQTGSDSRGRMHGSDRAALFAGLKDAEAAIASSKSYRYADMPACVNADARPASEVIRADAHSTDVWSTARALNVLREESYKFGGSPIIEKVLEDAARYLGEFGEIRSRAEASNRAEYISSVQQRACVEGRREILNSEAFREGERIIQERDSAQRKNEKRRTSRKSSNKAVKRG